METFNKIPLAGTDEGNIYKNQDEGETSIKTKMKETSIKTCHSSNGVGICELVTRKTTTVAEWQWLVFFL